MLEQQTQTIPRWTTPLWTMALGFLLATVALNGCGGGDLEAAQTETDLGSQLAAREASVADREAEVAIREAALATHDADLIGRLEDLDAREQALADQAESLASRAASLESRETALGKQKAALDSRRAALETSEIQVAADRTAAQRQAEEQARVARDQPPPEVYAEIDLPAQTLLDVEFLATVSSATSRPGDTIRTRLTADLHAEDGRLVIPAGTELEGVVTEAVPLKRVGGRAELGLRFGEIQLPWGREVEINASFYDASRDESRRDKKVIGRSAAGGAILGAILDDDDRGRGTVLGAILGAAAGTAASANRPRDEVEIAGGTIVTLELDEPVSVRVPWKSRYAAP